ncbi:hypothetical protein OHAE_842 [Ochrobactrum soli]|uniref:Uncharacterized protein n=1 Tax=Ochrobactrum soli TaxID=2448455 RepID=A0A2P9HLJ2_9HYPH|nr:hypothetical protein OHAE_842 [[Ochrobactrum] soli]
MLLSHEIASRPCCMRSAGSLLESSAWSYRLPDAARCGWQKDQ